MSAYTNLMGVVDAGKNGYEAEYLIERGRGYSSDAESWAALTTAALVAGLIWWK